MREKRTPFFCTPKVSKNFSFSTYLLILCVWVCENSVERIFIIFSMEKVLWIISSNLLYDSLEDYSYILFISFEIVVCLINGGNDLGIFFFWFLCYDMWILLHEGFCCGNGLAAARGWVEQFAELFVFIFWA